MTPLLYYARRHFGYDTEWGRAMHADRWERYMAAMRESIWRANREQAFTVDSFYTPTPPRRRRRR